MSRQVNINLAFTADTAQAKAQLQSLQQQLTSLINSPVGLGQKLTTGIQEATAAAAELKIHLQNATNVKTGTLDFGKLNQSLKASGTTLNHYAAQLQKLGPLGQQSFMQLARSVSMAEVPLKRSGMLLQSLGTTLANTVKWQMSSSLLHGFIRSVSSAYNYSKDLNQSLNNIRIVTGKNIDEMSKFAEEANKAAKSLSATTTEYTNASLIYYQQGLNDAEVKERTNATIKMANVTRQSAEVVSDQMTAIWNNFDDGSRSLEYYADVLTALGAATASSTDEISQGLEKFAAVANTVGLSYEYATAALATVTATTRQSADVVGTAFKTLFARIQDLNLGETLDDGTTLGKYSESLMKVGINIKNTNGELKDMDTILNEMGSKWNQLNKDQQVALAKSVAGIRQYTQLIALMDNWDFMKKNLNTVSESAGTLQDQAKIYSESWEAASKRVKASLETIYEAIMDDDFFIELTNDFADLIDKIGGFVKSIGGLQGVLAGLGMVLTKVFHQQLAQGFSNLAYNIAMSTKAGAEAVQQAKMVTMEQFANSMNSYNESTALGRTSKQVYTEELQMQSQLQMNAKNLTQEEQLKLKYMIDQTRIIGEQSIKLAEQVDIQKQLNSDRKTQLMGNALMAGNSMQDVASQFRSVEESAASVGHITTQLRDMRNASEISEQSVNELSAKLKELGFGKNEIANLTNGLQGLQGASTDAGLILDNIAASVSRVSSEMAETIVNLMGFRQGTEGYTEARQRVEEYLNGLHRTVTLQEDLKTSIDNGTQSAKQFGDTLAESGQRGQQSMSQLFATMTSGLMSAGMLISSINGLMDTIKNPDTTGWQKFGQILTSVSMISLSLMGVFKGLKAIMGVVKGLTTGETIAKIANATATWAQVKAEQKLNLTKGRGANATRRSIKQTVKDTWNKNAQAAYAGRYTKVDNVMINGPNGTEVGGYRNKSTGQLLSKSQYQAGLKGAGGSALKSLGTKLGAAAIVVAAVVASAAIIKAASDYYNRFEIAAQKARETATAMQKTYEDITNAESEFRSNIESYSSDVKGLEDLTKGTEEYKNAIREANNEAVKLINTHKNLKYEINDDGLIEIDEASLQAATQESLRKEARAQAASLAAEQDAENARLEADKINFQRTQMKAGGVHWDKDDTAIAAGGYGASATMAAGAVGYTAVTGGLAAVGAANAWNPVGWIMLGVAALGAIITTVALSTSNDADAREANTLKALEEFSINNNNRDLTKEEIEAIADQNDSTGKLADSLLEDVDATNSMIAEMRANTEAINRNNELMASQFLQNNDYVMGSDYADEIVEHSGLFEGQVYKEALAFVEESGWGKAGISKADGANAEAERVWSEYLTYAGFENKGWELVDTTGTDENRIFVYLDEQGQRQEKTLAEMQKMYAVYITESKTNINANELVGYFAEWSKKENAADQGIAQFLLNQNFENATKNQTESIQQEAQTQFNGDYNAYLESKLGDLEEAATRLGYENADKLIAAFTGALTVNDEAWGSIDFGNLSVEVSKNIETSGAQAIENLTKKMSGGLLGPEAGEIFTTKLNNILSQLDPKDQAEALNRIANIDWSQWDAGYLVVDVLKALGYEMDASDPAFQQWVSQMNRANGAAFDHAKALSEIAKMQDMVQDLKIGDIITSEDYDMLVKYNEEVAKFFRIMGDGNYKLVGDPLDAIQEIGKGIDRSYAKAVEGAQDKYDEALLREIIDARVAATNYNRNTLGASTWGVTKTETTYVDQDVEWYHHVGGFFQSLAQGMSAEAGAGSTVKLPGENAQDIANSDGKKPVTEKTYGIIDDKLYNAQVDFIDQYLVGYTSAQIEAWKNNKNKSNADQIAGIINDYLADHPAISADEITGYSIELEEAKEKQLAAEIDYAKTADSSKKLSKMYNSGQISEDAYNAAQMDFIMEEKWEGMDPNEIEEYADALQRTAKNSDILSNSLSDGSKQAEEAAEDVALYTKKMNQGIKKLSESIEDWSDIINKSDEGSEEYAEAMSGIKDAMSDVLGVSEEFISNDFIIKNMEDIEKAANGDAEAIDRLAIAAGKDILIHLELQDESVREELYTLHDQLAAEIPNIKVGATVDDAEFMAKAAQIVEAANMTVDQANAYFRSMGFEPHFETKEVEIDQPLKGIRTKTTKVETATTSTGYEYIKDMVQTEEEFDAGVAKKKVMVPAMTTDGGKPNFTLTRTNAGSMNNYSSSNSGGKSLGEGGSSNKKEPVKKSDVVERYKEINDQLEDISRNLDKINDKMDDAYGKARLDAMDEYIINLEKENEALEKKGKEIERNILADQQTVADAAAGVGMSVEFDENGNIANATQIEEAWYARLASATTKDEQDEIQGYIDIWEDAQEDYEDSLDEFWNNEDAKRANRRKQQEKEFAKWNYKIELDVELDEGELALIDYYQNKFSDDIYGMAESVALTGQEIDITLGNLANREKQYAELTSLYESGKISQAQYAEGLKELQEAELEDLETLQQLQEEMEEYYANTLAMASEELDKYTARLERSTAMLEHYQDLLDLTGQGQNYDAMGKVLDAQQKTINNQYESSKKEYEMYKRQADDSYQKMLNATTDEDRERYKKEWEEAEQYANDAQDRTVDNAKKKAEIAAAIYENTLNRLNKQMETTLTNGRSFDEVNMQMEHQQSLQEEYLTTTNKIYETTKMMRNLQNEIDKTTNRVAKQKLKAFQQETKQLQEQGKLSKFELDIQQAKYDLLLAEIALEEAQNAKSTVRLQRDSEGNFGYVYTADQEKVSDAAQAVDDAENALYNIQLEGANNYAEQSFQLQQEGLGALKELNESYRSGDIATEEEYQRRREEIINYYTQRLTDVSNLYGIAVADDSRVAADAWSTNIADLVADVDTWKTETNKYTSEVDWAFSVLNTELAKIAEEMGLNIEDLTATISNVTKESDKWAKEMQDDVIPDMEDTIEEVKTLADALLKKLTPQIKDAAKKGEILAEKMYKTQKKLSGLAGEAEKSAGRAANVAGQWRSYWDAVNNSDGGGNTADDRVPGPSTTPPTTTQDTRQVFKVQGTNYKSTDGVALIKFDNGQYGKIRDFDEVKNWKTRPRTGATTYDGYQEGFDSSSGTTIIHLTKPIQKFDTGGYTGEWGNEGKLAALHEKELILNKEDTKNFLASLELLHNIIKMIDINTSNSLINRLDSADLKTNKSNDVLEQHVTIEAVFPNVEDRYEIEEAFMNLTNEASQYINRKNN